MKLIAALLNAKQFLELLNGVIAGVRALIEFYKLRRDSAADNKKIDNNVRRVREEQKKVKAKLKVGQPVTKEDNEGVKRAARKLANDFGRI